MPGKIELRELTPAEVPKLYALHQEIWASLPNPAFHTSRTEKEFERLIAEQGFVLGAFQGERLCAYAGVLTPTDPWNGLDRALDELRVDLSSVARGSGAAVHPDFQGLGLLRLIDARRREIARSRDMAYSFGTLFPGNVQSFKSQLRNGYSAVGVHVDGDGDNLLMLRPTARYAPSLPSDGEVVALDDVDKQVRNLRRGTCAGAPIWTGDRYALSFMPWRDFRRFLGVS